jgi:hypothetical protein
MLQVSENKSLRLVHRVITNPRRFRTAHFQVSLFNMITHLGNTAERTYPPLAKVEQALGIATDKGKYGSGRLYVGRILFHKRPCGKGDRKRTASGPRNSRTDTAYGWRPEFSARQRLAAPNLQNSYRLRQRALSVRESGTKSPAGYTPLSPLHGSAS